MLIYYYNHIDLVKYISFDFLSYVRYPMTYNRQNARLKEFLAYEKVKDYLRTLYEPKYLAVALSRWRKGPQYPPVEVLVNIAKITGVSVDYILGLTDVKAPLNSEPGKEKTLDDLRDAAGLTQEELLRRLDKDSSFIVRYKKKLPLNRVSSLIFLAEALSLSIDFILGYSTWENWESFGRTRAAYRKLKAGTAAFVVGDRNVASLADVRKAVKKKDGNYCLVSGDGKKLIFPNGTEADAKDPVFEGAYFDDLKPGVLELK